MLDASVAKLNRRGFIGALAGFAAGIVLDPERALWVPGAKSFSIPNKIEDYLLEIDGQEFFLMSGRDGGITDSTIYYTERFVNGRSIHKRGIVLDGAAMFTYLHLPRSEFTSKYPHLVADMQLPRRSMVADNPSWSYRKW